MEHGETGEDSGYLSAVGRGFIRVQIMCHNHHNHHSNHHHYGPLSKSSGVIKLVPKATASQCTTLVLSKALKAIVSKWVQGKNYLKHRHNSVGNFLVSDPVLVMSGQFGFLITCKKIAMIA